MNSLKDEVPVGWIFWAEPGYKNIIMSRLKNAYRP